MVESDMTGFAKEFLTLKNLAKHRKLPQTMLIYGSDQDPKRKSAFIQSLIAVIMCKTGEGCGVCSACQGVKTKQHPDLLWLELSEGDDPLEDGKPVKKAYFLVEHAHRIQDHLSLTHIPSGPNALRVVVLIEAALIRMEAANRLLKICEEPPPNSLVLMSTERRHDVLQTLRSRAFAINLTPPYEPLTSYLLRDQQELSHWIDDIIAFMGADFKSPSIAAAKATILAKGVLQFNSLSGLDLAIILEGILHEIYKSKTVVHSEKMIQRRDIIRHLRRDGKNTAINKIMAVEQFLL